MISIIGTLIVLLGYLAGYISAGHRWWWTVFAVIIVYAAIYKLVDVAHH